MRETLIFSVNTPHKIKQCSTDLIVGISLYLCFIRVSSFMWKIIDFFFKNLKDQNDWGSV